MRDDIIALHLYLAMGDDIMISLKNLEECTKFLWGDPGSEKVRRSVDRLVENFQVESGTTMRPIIVSVTRGCGQISELHPCRML